MKEGIRLTGTKLNNFAGFPAVSIEYPEGTSYLCGPNGSGKSTLTLVQLQACISGIGEKNTGGNLIGSRFTFIGKSGASADVINKFRDERTSRTFSIKNHITVGSNSIKIIPDDDKPIPEEWVCDFFSVNLMSEKHFCTLSSKDQALALGVDTAPFDARLKELKAEYATINATIRAFGEIAEVEPVEPVNIDALKAKKKQVSDQLNRQYVANREKNAFLKSEWESARNQHNKAIDLIKRANEICEARINRCEDALTALSAAGYAGAEVRAFIDSLPVTVPTRDFDTPEPEYAPEMPDRAPLDAVDAEIEAAHETNARAERYAEYQRKVAARTAAMEALKANEAKQSEEKQARIEYIRQFDFGFSGLDTNELGELQLNGRPIREPYFSTGERIRIVAKLMRSRSPLFKTVFLDSYCELDEVQGPKLLDDLVSDGFHPIVSLPRERPLDGENCIVLRDCQIVGDEKGEKLI